MRGPTFLVSILLLGSVCYFGTVSAIDYDTGIEMSVVYDSETEIASVTITAPETSNITLLDELKNTEFVVYRSPHNAMVPGFTEIVATGIKICEQTDLNSECSGSSITFQHYPNPSNYSVFFYYLVLENNQNFVHSVALAANITQEVSPPVAVENLTASYVNGITDLTWDYPLGLDMNHSIMIYSHESPATRENWDSMPKTIISSNVQSGINSFQINHSGNNVERSVYYSVTLLYATSEDTRFLGTNTLHQPILEDNVAPVYIGELDAAFNFETQKTTLEWTQSNYDEDLSINIYRLEHNVDVIDPDLNIATINALTSTYDIDVPFGEHRQSSYAITLVDQAGNEILDLTEGSPVSDPIIESTIETTTVTNLRAERFSDGTIVLNWDDNTNNPTAQAKVWRSISGQITSTDDIEELGVLNSSLEQFSFNPVNSVDEAWYAITLDAAWGSSQQPWHDERMILGTNSLEISFQETELKFEETVLNVSAHVLTSSGFRANLSDGSMINLGAMYEGDVVIISTSQAVERISCNDIEGLGSVLFVENDWALTFDSNKSGQKCLGTIVSGEDEIGFTVTWNFVEPESICVEGDTRSAGDGCNYCVCDAGQWACTEIACEDSEVREDSRVSSEDGELETVGEVILGVIILALFVYLVVMMRSPLPEDLYEEE